MVLRRRSYLHSTMYLFQQRILASSKSLVVRFTFHYASISTFCTVSGSSALFHLHSTMYLFQLAITDMSDNANKIFTFHYVSISTNHQ